MLVPVFVSGAPVTPTFTYDAVGNQLAATDALSHTTRTYYDDLNRTVAVVANLTGQAITVTTAPAYSNAYPDRNVRAFTSYDQAGRVLETIDNAGLVTRNTYDAVGRAITTTVNYSATGPVNDTINLASGTVYDKLGYVTRRIDAEGVVTGFGYDSAGRLILVTENLRVPYDDETSDRNVRTYYTYDGRGNRLTIEDANDHVTTFTYDDLDRQKTETDALSHTWTTNYNKIGLQTSLVDAKGQTTAYQYDELRRVITVDYPTGTADVSFTYDALGNRVTMGDGTGTTSWTLDALNRPITITAPSGAVGYGYDRLGNRTQLRYPDTKAVTYTMDALGRIQTVLDWASQTTSYTYNAVGQVVTTTLPNGVRTVYGYDAAQRLETLTHSTATQVLGAYTYTVDATGTRTQVVERLQVPDQPVTGTSAQPGFGSVNSGVAATNGSRFSLSGATGGAAHAWAARWPASTSTTTRTVTTTTTITYGYDSLYRLTDATYSNGTLFGYQYDSVGNVLTKTETIAGTSASRSYSYDDANRQTSADGLTQTYDDNGNLLSDGATAYTWDGANRMTASGGTAYTYNGVNDRVSAGGVTHQLDLNTGLTQVLADGTSTYLIGVRRLGEQQGATWQYHLADGLGSVRQLVNANGVVSATKSYEPYGEVLSSAGTASSAFGFTGEQQGNLVYLRARYYQAEAMRFASRDLWVGDYRSPRGYNRWTYALGNVITRTDPSGLSTSCQSVGRRRATSLSVFLQRICASVRLDEIVARGQNWLTFSQMFTDPLLNGPLADGAGRTVDQRVTWILSEAPRRGGNQEWARAFGDRDCYLQSQFRDSQFYADSSSTGSWSPRHEGKSNQIGHFLDAVKPARIYGEVNDAIARLLGTTPELSATSDLHNVLIDGIVGHEMAGDDQGGLLQTGVGFANNFGGSLTKQFLKAVEFDTKGFEVERDEILARMVFGDSAVSERYYDPARSGNSIQDLRLTLKGYRFALWSLRNPSPPMVAANWLQNNLMVRTTRTSRK